MLSSLPRDTGMGSSNSWFPVPHPETASSGCPGAGVLSLGTVCTSGQSCDTTPSTCHTMFRGLPGGLPEDASGTLSPSWDNQKCLQTLPSVPGGQNAPLLRTPPSPVENHCLKGRCHPNSTIPRSQGPAQQPPEVLFHPCPHSKC